MNPEKLRGVYGKLVYLLQVSPNPNPSPDLNPSPGPKPKPNPNPSWSTCCRTPIP